MHAYMCVCVLVCVFVCVFLMHAWWWLMCFCGDASLRDFEPHSVRALCSLNARASLRRRWLLVMLVYNIFEVSLNHCESHHTNLHAHTEHARVACIEQFVSTIQAL